MKVLFISHEARRNGAPIALLQELSYIKNNCPDITPAVLVLKNGDLLDEFSCMCTVYKGWNLFFDYLNIILHKLNFKKQYHPFYYWRLKKKFNCIYANTILSLQEGCYLKQKLGIPLVVHVHEAECLMHKFKINISLLKNVDSYIAVSNLAAINLLNNYSISYNKIRIQPPFSYWVDKYLGEGVDIVPYQFDKNKLLVGCFVDNEWFKSIELIPVFLKVLYAKYPNINCRFALVGLVDDEVKWRIEYELQKTNNNNKVMWLDQIKEPLNIHQRLDVLLLLSREESFSLVAQESAIMRTPIIGFHGTVGIEEWIGKEGGIWVPYLDFNTMADNLFQICEDEVLRTTLGDMVRNKILEMFNESKRMQAAISTIRLYE